VANVGNLYERLWLLVPASFPASSLTSFCFKNYACFAKAIRPSTHLTSTSNPK
jgi:hypothetical protein